MFRDGNWLRIDGVVGWSSVTIAAKLLEQGLSFAKAVADPPTYGILQSVGCMGRYPMLARVCLFLILLGTALQLQAAAGGFLFVTFKGEQTAMGEQIYFAVSADGRHWTALNDAEPVLVSELGERGVRDPYLVRAHDGKQFFLIATDLSIHNNRDWQRAVRAGSRSIVIWESLDLVRWSKPRLVAVAPIDAGCTWAPEAIYDEQNGDYLVFWASTTRADNYHKHRIWAARTRDFREFSAPFVYIEKPTTIIDTTIVRDGENYYRFTKDEKFKAITMETAGRLAGPWTDVPDFSLANLQGYEGPEAYLIERGADGKQPVWGLILDNYARRRGYQPYVSQNLASGKFEPGEGFSFPFPFRHGAVLPLSAEELAGLQLAYRR